MHEKNIMHRDLKLENILCEAPINGSDDIIVKLTDFGFATQYNESDKKRKPALGSPHYMAPELVRETFYDQRVDVWAVGIIAFILLLGKRPFNGIGGYSATAVYRDILETEPDYDSLLINYSPQAIHFVKMALIKNYKCRPNADELLYHPWIQQQTVGIGFNNRHELDVSANLLAFTHTTPLQSGVCSIIANLMTGAPDLQYLREMFIKWDSNNDGVISIDELEQNINEVAECFRVESPDVMAMMTAMDTDKDGALDYTEFLTAAIDKHKLLAEP